MASVMSPSQVLLKTDLEDPAFRCAELEGRWRHEGATWPHSILSVKAAARPKAPEWYAFRFECSGYRQTPVTAQLWDISSNAPLTHARWPTGKLILCSVFRPEWRNGSCVYLPCDRLSMEGHPNWVSQYPQRLWDPNRGIIGYLEQLHELLVSNDYTGTRCS